MNIRTPWQIQWVSSTQEEVVFWLFFFIFVIQNYGCSPHNLLLTLIRYKIYLQTIVYNPHILIFFFLLHNCRRRCHWYHSIYKVQRIQIVQHDILQTVLHWGAKHGNSKIIQMFAGKYKVDVNGRTVSFLLNIYCHYCRIIILLSLFMLINIKFMHNINSDTKNRPFKFDLVKNVNPYYD